MPGAVSILLVCAHSLSRKAHKFWAMKRNTMQLWKNFQPSLRD